MPAGMTIRQTGESPRTGGADGWAGPGRAGRAPTTTGDWAGPSGHRGRPTKAAGECPADLHGGPSPAPGVVRSVVPPADRPVRSRPDPGPSCSERAPLAWADRFGEAGAAMRIETTHRVDHPHRDVVDWHERPGALIRLTPPGLATPDDPAEGGTSSEEHTSELQS